ncbi:MAG: 2-oxo acid dehydrogenase subunit E2, partial [Bacteroidales bacterium]
WRDKVKETFEKREGTKLTFMPAFIEATAKALKDFPMVNASVDGYKIILKKRINIGIAVALPSGNLIVPVIKDADKKSLLGLAADLNALAESARKNKLSPDDIAGGTFTITNFGTFKNLYGTPIINQPLIAILATGMIQKKPAVLETPAGDVIAIRHKMYLALTYDHRVIDGALGGAFLRRIADYLEQWDVNRGF